MSPRSLIMISMTVGSMIGAYVPMLWGDNSLFSMPSIVFTAVGGFLGIWIGYKLKNN